MRFITLLHKRVVPDVLGGISTLPQDPDALNQVLDALPPLSNSVVVALEEVVAALYAPQDPNALGASALALVETIRAVHASATVILLLPPTNLEEELGGLSIDGAKGGEEKAKDPRKWFDSCLAQVDKSAKIVLDDLLRSQVDAT